MINKLYLRVLTFSFILGMFFINCFQKTEASTISKKDFSKSQKVDKEKVNIERIYNSTNTSTDKEEKTVKVSEKVYDKDDKNKVEKKDNVDVEKTQDNMKKKLKGNISKKREEKSNVKYSVYDEDKFSEMGMESSYLKEMMEANKNKPTMSYQEAINRAQYSSSGKNSYQEFQDELYRSSGCRCKSRK